MSNKAIIKLFFITIGVIFSLLFIQEYFEIEIISPKDRDKEYSYFSLFFPAVILAPVVEEFIFRYPLLKGNRPKWLYFSLILGFLFTFAHYEKNLWVSVIGIFLYIAIFVQYFVYKKTRVSIYLAILSAFLFSLGHFSDFNSVFLGKFTAIAIIFQIFPQFLLGLVLTYLRLREVKYYKIVLFHSAYNFLLASIGFLALYFEES